MSLIEGIGDEVTHFFLLLFAAVIAYIAWWSTNISEQRQFRTVLLLDRRRHPTRSILRVRVPSRQLSNHTETVTISEGTSSNSSTSVQTEESAQSTILTETDSTPQTSSAEPKSDIVPSSSSTSQSTVEGTVSDVSEETEDRAESRRDSDSHSVEVREIIETMDADTQNELRQRRLAHFEGAGSGTNTQQSTETQPPHPVDTPSPNSSEGTDNTGQPKASNSSQDTNTFNTENENKNSDCITIKLKYINDDIKVVDGRLEELLGDFKRRHFLEELNANKDVKLIFNGQVLKQDRSSLQSCGLFDNCVVHCLIHQKRPSLLADRDRQQDNINETIPQFLRENPFVHVTNVNNNNQGIEWDLGNFLFAVVSFILLAAWYFRYVYAHLYTVTATVGLIIITGIFSIVLLGAYFPDNELPDANLRIRVTRTERTDAQQRAEVQQQ